MNIFNLWLTGLSGSGKTTLAHAISKRLQTAQIPHEVLDGDQYRAILSPDAGYTEKERNDFRKKIIFLAKMLNRHGVSCIFPLLSSSRAVREYARSELTNFYEIYVRCPIDICEARDPKGLYALRRRGEESNIVGIDIAYEAPEAPDVVVDTDKQDIKRSVEQILTIIKEIEFK